MIINSQKKIDFFKRYFAKKNLICVDTEFERKKLIFQNYLLSQFLMEKNFSYLIFLKIPSK